MLSVLKDLGGTHRRGMVLSDGRQHHHKWLNRPDTQGVERGHGAVYQHTVWPYLHGQVYAPPQKYVSHQ